MTRSERSTYLQELFVWLRCLQLDVPVLTSHLKCLVFRIFLAYTCFDECDCADCGAHSMITRGTCDTFCIALLRLYKAVFEDSIDEADDAYLEVAC